MTVTPAITAYVAGQTFRFKAANANTGASTLAVSGLGTKTIQFRQVALLSGMIAANELIEVEYDGTQFQMLSPSSASDTPNMARNPSMRFHQAGGSFTGLGTTSTDLLEGWRYVINSASETWRWTFTQATGGGLSGLEKWLKAECTTADASPAATDRASVEQRLEGQFLQELNDFGGGGQGCRDFMVSLDVIAHAPASSPGLTFPATGALMMRSADGTNYMYSSTVTIAADATWERVDVSFSASGNPLWSNDNGLGATLAFAIDGGSTVNGMTADTWGTPTGAHTADISPFGDYAGNYIGFTRVDMYPGAVARPFKSKPYDQDLASEQRYFYQINLDTIANERVPNHLVKAYTTSASHALFNHPVPMRASPSMGTSAAATWILSDVDGGGSITLTSFTWTGVTEYVAVGECGDSGAGFTVGVGFLQRDASDTTYYSARNEPA